MDWKYSRIADLNDGNNTSFSFFFFFRLHIFHSSTFSPNTTLFTIREIKFRAFICLEIFQFYMKNGRAHLRWCNLLSQTIFFGREIYRWQLCCAVWVCDGAGVGAALSTDFNIHLCEMFTKDEFAKEAIKQERVISLISDFYLCNPRQQQRANQQREESL